MDIEFDIATRQLTITPGDIQPRFQKLRAIVRRHGQPVPLTGVEMRCVVTADGVQIADIKLPPPGTSLEMTYTDVLGQETVRWDPEQEIVVTATLLDGQGIQHTATETFTVPIPPSPYPSWEWINGDWRAPVDYPDDGKVYVWDEAGGAWV